MSIVKDKEQEEKAIEFSWARMIGPGLLVIIRTYTIIGSLCIPFLGATLLYLNNRFPTTSGVPRNSALNNALLALSLIVFGIVGVQEVLVRF